MESAQTYKIGSAIVLTGSYQNIDSSGVPNLSSKGQAVLTFKRSSGSTVTFKVSEQFNSLTGFVPRTEDDGTVLTLIERTSTLSDFSYAFQSVCEALQVSLKGTGTYDVYLTVGD